MKMSSAILRVALTFSLIAALVAPATNAVQAKSKKKDPAQDPNSMGQQQQQQQQISRLIPMKIAADGMMREIYVHLPPPIEQALAMGQQPPSLPLVLVFHGGLGLATRMDELTGFDAIADREGFVVVYPQGVNKLWNDGRNIEGADKFDDVAFTKAIIDHMQNRYHTDSQHTYACGISNGGFFAQHLALMEPGRFAAIASVAATLPMLTYTGRPALKPMSVLYILGLDDPLMPFKGGPVHFKSFRDRGMVTSAAEAAQFWVKADKAQKVPQSFYLPDTDPSDKCRVKVATFGGGLRNTEVMVYGIEGGGHTWPGGPQYQSEGNIGPTCRDISASEVIWDFFKRH